MPELSQYKDYFREYQVGQEGLKDGFFANFVGVCTDHSFLERGLPTDGGRPDNPCYGPGVPQAYWGETFFEWITLIDSIREAREHFTMMELGSGYAARTVNADAALKAAKPLPAFYVVVEAEPTNFAWAQRHMRNNGIDPATHWMLNIALSDGNVPDLFPLRGGDYGNNVYVGGNRENIFDAVKAAGALEPVLRNVLTTSRIGLSFGDSEDSAAQGHDIGFVSALTLADILSPLVRVDLIDMDIQSAEFRVIPPAMDVLDRKVRRMQIGTHGKEVHEHLVKTFALRGWEIVFDFEPNSRFESDLGAFETDDGILAVVNPRLQIA